MNFVKNAVGREIPDYMEGIGSLTPFKGAQEPCQEMRRHGRRVAKSTLGKDKVVNNIRKCLEMAGIKDGMTISFHHHFRNGDLIMNMIMDEIAAMGIKDITIAPSSLLGVHEHLIQYIHSGVITGIETSGIRGGLGEAISRDNILKKPVIFRTHGGRARAIECGDLKIDIAFIGAPSADPCGNLNGVTGKAACGSLGYALVDAEYAEKVVAVTDNLVEYPLFPISIPQTCVDYVLTVDKIGDPSGIVSGATRLTKNPMELLIAEMAAKAVEASGLVKNGYSFQAGTGGASLAVAHFLREYMRENNITGSFASGGINGYVVDMLEEGLFKALFDVQCFDLKAVDSIRRNPNHMEMSSSYYANPFNKGCLAEQLDVMILSATEIDTNFNINVMTGSNGVIMGAQGGHPDTAAGAKLSIVVAPLLRGRIPIVVDSVTTVVTPGESVDAVVTERGIAVNPRRKDLKEAFMGAKLPVMEIEDLKEIAEKLTGKPDKVQFDDDIVGIIEYRDGTIMDVVRKIKKK